MVVNWSVHSFPNYTDFAAYLATIPGTEEIQIEFAPDDVGWVVCRSSGL